MYTMTIIKCIVGFLLALILSKIIGRKIISKMNFIDLVMGVSMGSMIANAVIDKDSPIESEVIALILFGILTIFTSFISLKSRKIRKILSSESIILVRNGVILNKNLKKVRISVEELMMKLREKGAFNLEEVEYAIMESDGKMSLLTKKENKITISEKKETKIDGGGLLKDLVIDGKFVKKDLSLEGIDIDWVREYLDNKRIDLSEVFYAGIDENKKIVISKRLN